MKNFDQKNIILFILIIIIVIVNYISSIKFFRIDLTSEKRHTLSKQTKEIIKNLDNPVYIHIYIDGDLPIGFKRLQRTTKEMIEEFRAYAKSNVQYKFINPSESTNLEEREMIYTELADKGIQPISINLKDREGGMSQKLIFPGAIASYSGKELPVNLLENNPGLTGEENLNNSIEGLEYKFSSTIKRITTDEKLKIAFIEGNDELDEYEIADITAELAKYYIIERVTINGINHILDSYALVIIAKPLKPFIEKDKFIIDQYLMRGGKLFWLIDAVNLEAGSLSTQGSAFAFYQATNLEDQLFRYGVRINPVLVEDLQSAIIPVNTSIEGQQPNFVPAPWLYFPLINGSPEHPITRNLNMIKAEYISTIDTVGENYDLKKTVLLHSSDYSRIKIIPAMISISEVMEEQDERTFTNKYLSLGILLEGQFESVFQNRIITEYSENIDDFISRSKSTKMIVIADGDVIRNNVRQRADGYIIEPLGYDRYTSHTFGNKQFIMNAVNYLTDESGLIELRSKEIELRLLNRQKIFQSRLKWQFVNIIIPCLVIILFGFIYNLIRKQRFS